MKGTRNLTRQDLLNMVTDQKIFAQISHGIEYKTVGGRLMQVPKVIDVKITCYESVLGNYDYSVTEDKFFGSSMTVESIGTKFLKLFTYDMLGNKTSTKIPYPNIIIKD